MIKKKRKIITSIMTSTALIGGATTGIIVISEPDTKEEETEKKKNWNLKKIIFGDKKNFGTIFTNNKDLPTADTIKNILKSRNLGIDISKIKITNITANSAEISSNDLNFYNNEKVIISYIVQNKIALITVIKTTDLDEIIIQKNTLTKKVLLKAIKDKNPNTTKDLTESNFTIKKLKKSSNQKNINIIINGIGKYEGEVILKFRKKENGINLQSIIFGDKKNLGIIVTNNKNLPTADTIKNILKSRNLGIDISKIKITNITANSAEISSNDLNFYNNEKVIINYITNKFVHLNNIVADLNKRNKKVDTFWHIHHAEIKNFLWKNDRGLANFNEFLDELNEIVKFKANQTIINDFTKLENNKTIFKSFLDLEQQFNNKHLSKGGLINFTTKFIDKIRNNMKKKNITEIDKKIDEIKNELVRFYNIFAQVYTKENLFKMLKSIELDENLQENSGGTLGQMEWSGCKNKICSIVMTIDTDNFHDVKKGIGVLAHEYGHVLDYFFSYINSKTKSWMREYMINCLASQTKITDPDFKELLTYGIIRSSYGINGSTRELFAEGFMRWIMTPEKNRDLGWEKLDIFFRIDLPKLL